MLPSVGADGLDLEKRADGSPTRRDARIRAAARWRGRRQTVPGCTQNGPLLRAGRSRVRREEPAYEALIVILATPSTRPSWRSSILNVSLSSSAASALSFTVVP